MKAVVIDEHGDIERLRFTDVRVPVVGDGEALVEIRAAALNFLDVFVRRGIPGIKLAMPHILGADAAGIVRRLGGEGADVSEGDRVAINPGLSCGACLHCARGDDNVCVDYKIIGEHVPGTYAQFISVPRKNLIRIPAAMPFDDAAAFPLVYMTAWRMLKTRAGLRPRERVLVLGASGGVSSAAIQIAKHLGALVAATAGGEEKMERAARLGADFVVDSRSDWGKAVYDWSGRNGVDVVIDNVGQETWKSSIRALARGGRLVTCGATTGPFAETDLRHVFWKHLSILGSTMCNMQEFRDVMQLAFEGRLKVVVDRAMPLSEAKAAQLMLEERRHFGKIVLHPW